MSKYIIMLIAILVSLVFALGCLLKKANNETRLLKGNQHTLMEDVRFYKTQDSLSAAGIDRLRLEKKEFETYCGDLRKVINNLNIKVKRLQSVSVSGIETKYDVQTVIRDSVLLRDSLVPLKCIHFSNPYLELSGCMENNRFAGNIVSRDTLIQVIHRVPKQFWFIKWGTKAIRQEIVSRNPYSNITYLKYIELK